MDQRRGRELDTEDREFAYRLLRAWLHTLRDRLTVQASAHFAAQLPDLIRGVFYAGWNPNAVPEKYNAEEYSVRFLREANISLHDVGKVAAVTTAAVSRHLPPAHLDKALDQLPTRNPRSHAASAVNCSRCGSTSASRRILRGG